MRPHGDVDGLQGLESRARGYRHQRSARRDNPYGVWLFNGVTWFPSPGFPGYNVCPGRTVVWAGKLDYWLIGGPTDLSWSRLCRFDGATLEWESLELPEATKQHVTVVAGKEERRRPGGITSAACLAWNDCWFFGTYGTVMHWDGTQLSDASPDPSLSWLQGEYTAAVARQDPQGDPFGVAVGATAEFHGADIDERSPARTRRGGPARDAGLERWGIRTGPVHAAHEPTGRRSLPDRPRRGRLRRRGPGLGGRQPRRTACLFQR